MSETEKKQTREQFADWFRTKTGETVQDDPPEAEAKATGYPIVKDAGEAPGKFYTPNTRDQFADWFTSGA